MHNAQVEFFCIVGRRQRPQDIYLEAVINARGLVFWIIASAAWQLGRDELGLLFTIADAHECSARLLPLWRPPEVVADIDDGWRQHHNLVPAAIVGVAGTDPHCPRPARAADRHHP